MVNLSPDEGSQSKKFPVDPVQDSLEEVSLSLVLTVKQLQKLKNKVLVDVPLPNGCIEVRRFQKPQENSIDKLARKR